MSNHLGDLWHSFDQNPGDDGTFLKLFRALNGRREYEALASLYRRRAESVDAEQAVYLYLTVADVWSQHLGMPGLATEALLSTYAISPSLPFLRERLQQHLSTERDWNMFARFMALELGNADSPFLRGMVSLSFGHLLHRRLRDFVEASRMYLDAAKEPSVRRAATFSLRRLQQEEPNFAEIKQANRTLDQISPVSVTHPQAVRQRLLMKTLSTEKRSHLLLQLSDLLFRHPSTRLEMIAHLKECIDINPNAIQEVRVLLRDLVIAAPDEPEALSLFVVSALTMPAPSLQQWQEIIDFARLGPLITENIEHRSQLLMLLANIEAKYLANFSAAVDFFQRASALGDEQKKSAQEQLKQLSIEHPEVSVLQSSLGNYPRGLAGKSTSPNMLAPQEKRIQTPMNLKGIEAGVSLEDVSFFEELDIEDEGAKHLSAFELLQVPSDTFVEGPSWEGALNNYRDFFSQAPAKKLLQNIEKIRRSFLHPQREDREERLGAFLSMLDALLSASPLPPEVVILSRLRADLLTEDLGVHPRTRAAWQAVLLHVPEDPKALEALKCFPAKEPSLSISAQADAAPTLLSGGETLLQRIEILEGHLSSEPKSEPLILQLEQAYRATKNPKPLVRLLTQHLSICQDQTRRKTLLLERAQVYASQLNTPSLAIADYLSIIEISPLEKVSLRALYALYRASDQHEALFLLLPNIIQAFPDQRLEWVLSGAGLLEGPLNRPEDAFASYRQAYDLDPKDPRAPRALWRLARQKDQWGALVEFLEIEASLLSEPVEQAKRLREISSLAELQLGDLYQALHLMRMAFQLSPQDPQLLSELERVAKAGGFWQELASVYRTLADLSDDPKKQAQHLQTLSHLTGLQLQNPQGAFDVLCEASLCRPDDLGLLRELDQLAEEHELWEERLDFNESRMEQTSDIAVLQGILRNSSEISVLDLQNNNTAIQYLLRAWILSPASNELKASLIKLTPSSEELGAEILKFTCDVIERHPSQQHSNALHLKAIALFDLLNAEEEALQTLLQGLFDRPHNEALFEALRSMGARSRSLPNICKSIEDRLSQTNTLAERLPWFNKKAQLEEDFGGLEQAIETLQTWLKIAPDEPNLHARIENLHLQLEENLDAPSIVIEIPVIPLSDTDVLRSARAEIEEHQRSLKSATNPENRAWLFWKIATLHRDELSDLEQACALLEQALAEDRGHFESLRDLGDLYLKKSHWESAAALYQVLTSPTPPRSRSGARRSIDERFLRQGESLNDSDNLIFTLRLAHCLEKTQDLNNAIDLYCDALLEASDHPLAVSGKARCYYARGNWNLARPLLETLTSSPPPLERNDLAYLYFLHGSILKGSQSFYDARAAFEEALVLAPDLRWAADQALAIIIEQKDWEAAPEAILRLLDLTVDAEEKGAISKRLGEVYDFFLQKPRDAILAYEQSLMLGGDSEDVPLRLLRLYMDVEEWEKGLIITESLLLMAPQHSREHADLLLVKGDILNIGLADFDHAFDSYSGALEEDPENLLALDRLSQMFAKRGEFESIHRLNIAFMERIPEEDIERRAEVFQHYGRLLIDLKESPTPESLSVFKRLMEIIPDDALIHTNLFELFSSDQHQSPAAELIHLRKLISLKPLTLEHLHRLHDLYLATDERDGAAEIKTLISISIGEHRSLSETPPTPPDFEPGALSGEVYEWNVATEYASGPLAQFLELMGDLGLDELGENIEFSGLISVKELTRLSTSPVSMRFAQINEAMGLGERRLFIRSGMNVPYQIFASIPPSIALSDTFVAGRSENEWRFILARVLELSRSRFILASSLGAFSFLTVLRTLLMEISVDPVEIEASLTDPQTKKRVMRFLETLRTSRSIELQEELQSLVEEVFHTHGNESPSAKRYVMAARATSVRVGLLACNDQRVAIDYLLKEEELGGVEKIDSFNRFTQFLEASADLRSLIQYLVSEEYLLAREALKVPKTLLSDLIRLPPKSLSQSAIPIADPSADSSANSFSDLSGSFSIDSALSRLFSNEIEELIDNISLDDILPSSTK